jgi:hypothetical protein
MRALTEMRGGWRVWTLLAGLLISLGACSGNCSSVTVSQHPAKSPVATLTPSPQPVPPAIAGLPLHDGEVGVVYPSATLGASGGTVPYQWSISGGAMPPGLSLSPDGSVAGTPTTPGLFNFTVQVAEAPAEPRRLPRQSPSKRPWPPASFPPALITARSNRAA